jgi:hypothetical protein
MLGFKTRMAAATISSKIDMVFQIAALDTKHKGVMGRRLIYFERLIGTTLPELAGAATNRSHCSISARRFSISVDRE